jgi:hypothetical protein
MCKPKQKRQASNILVLLVLSVLMLGCSMGKENILFITKTSLGVDIDSKPPTLDIGYTRKEATLSPKFEGGVLPQMASFKTDIGFVNTAVGQSFATGNAALLMSKYMGMNSKPADRTADISISEIQDNNKDSWVKGSTSKSERYFFGTDTSFALKVTFGLETGGYPDSLSLGYKRKEVAFVPLMETDQATATAKVGLPSLIATAEMGSETSNIANTNVQFKQFYATGVAASYLAAQPEIRQSLGAKIMDDPKLQKILETRQAYQSQSELSEKIITAFKAFSADSDKQAAIFDKGISLEIISDSLKDKTKDEKIKLFESRIAMYVNKNIPDGLEKLKLLEGHINSLK